MIEFLQNNWLWFLPLLFIGLYLLLGGCEIGYQNRPKDGSGEESKNGGKVSLPLTCDTLSGKKEGEHHA